MSVLTIRVARGPFARMRGLIGRTALGPDEALLLRPCARVHTFGLRFAIDAVFCDAKGVVLSVQTLRPGRFSKAVRGARSCLELAAGRSREHGIDIGTRLALP
jgi:uncharacterized membrane protein (UPF0127 family)